MLLPPYPPKGYPEEGWPLPSTVAIHENLELSPFPPLHADLLSPRTQKHPLPAVVWLHGGGWRWGNRRQAMERLFLLVEAGFVCIPVDYRLTDSAIFPAQLEDVKTAVRWVVNNAVDLGVDAARIALFGGSAGGHLGLLAALSGTPDIAAVVAAFPPTDLLTLDEFPEGVESVMEHHTADSCEGRLLGGAVADQQDKARQASPIHHIRADAPPCLLLHGELDAYVSVHQSRQMTKAMTEAGCDVTYREFPKGGHSAREFPADWVVGIQRWLEEQLR